MTERVIPRRKFTLAEYAVVLLVAAVAAALLLARFIEYRSHAEDVALRHMLSALRLALQVEAARGAGMRGPQALQALVGSNPMDLLDGKPVNYLGEIDDIDNSSAPDGSWLFNRRDKTLVYLPFSSENFTFTRSRLLRFKVEFTYMSGASGSTGQRANVGLALTQIGDEFHH